MYEKKYHEEDLNRYSFLVTGGAGFIGSNIVEYLVKYDAPKITVIDNLSSGSIENIKPFMNLKNFEFINADIKNYNSCLKACKNVDIVFHEAALCSVPRSVQNPVATNESNVNGFVNMLFAAKESKVRRFIYASSSSVYGDNNTLPKKEEITGNPLSPYAVSKISNELYSGVFRKIYDMNIVGLRYFNIFGPRQNPDGPYAAVIPIFITALLNNIQPAINGDGEQTRDFTFIENAVQANIKAAFSDITESKGKVFNIACGRKTSINKLYELIKNLTASSIFPVYNPERTGDIKNSYADINKAQKLINYNPEIELETGLKITLDWFKRKM
ncbi:MAG: SDR family oxidoreductase [Bacteroidales bacterium]|jgi:UDP-N-acetylglucosamine 4-epimerase